MKLDKYISDAYVFGDGKPYLVALLTPNIERLIDLGRELEIDYIDIAELVTHARVMAVYTSRVEAINAGLPSYKTIKRFAVLPREFSIEGGELTPTLKLKRKDIYNKYKEIIEELYMKAGNGLVGRPKNNKGE
jgi:long-chain acyl-CoA synthetase